MKISKEEYNRRTAILNKAVDAYLDELDMLIANDAQDEDIDALAAEYAMRLNYNKEG